MMLKTNFLNQSKNNNGTQFQEKDWLPHKETDEDDTEKKPTLNGLLEHIPTQLSGHVRREDLQNHDTHT